MAAAQARPPRDARGYDARYARARALIAGGVRGRAREGLPVACVICKKRIAICESQIVNAKCVNHKSCFTIEHVTPLRLGGSNDLANLGPAHPSCNYGWRRKAPRP